MGRGSRLRRPISSESLALVRRFTGDAFKAARGYDLRKGLNFGQSMAVLKYARKIAELTSKPTVTYRPKRGEKTEAFEYTGQRGYRKFDVALVEHVDPDADLVFTMDKSRPKGSRFVPVNKKTGQRYYHLPGRWFVFPDYDNPEFIEWLDTMGHSPDDLDEDDLDELYTEYLIDTAAGDAELFLVQAGDSYMWSSGGDKKTIVPKIMQIKDKYGDNFFDPNNKNSHHYENWFKGVTGFQNFYDGLNTVERGFAKKRARMQKYHIQTEQKWRVLDSAQYRPTRQGHWTAGFTNGRMTSPPRFVEYETRPATPKGKPRR